jgi:hypothetical protein
MTMTAQKAEHEPQFAVVSQMLPPPDPQFALIQAIERIALDNSIDIARLERMLQMRDKIEAETARKAFASAMAAAQAEMLPVVRKAHNDQTASNYATLDAIAKAIQPIVTKHGFSTSYGMEDSPLPDHYRITLDVDHVAGHTKHLRADIPIDAAGIKGTVNKTRTHAFGSTISYGRRYLKLLAFDVSTSEDDDGNAAGKPVAGTINEDEWRILRDLIEKAGADVIKFLAALGCGPDVTLEELPAAKFEAAKAMLWQKIAQPIVKGAVNAS